MRFLFVFLLLSASVFGQKGRFHNVYEENGDLDQDGINDRVVVLQDTIDDRFPYRLQIFLGSKKILESDEVIPAKYPDGRNQSSGYEDLFSVEIDKGVLTVVFDLLRGNYAYKFRWKPEKNDFAMIGFTSHYSDGVQFLYYTDFNLNTGSRIETRENYETGKVLSSKKSKLMIRPLPLLSQIRLTFGEPYKTD